MKEFKVYKTVNPEELLRGGTMKYACAMLKTRYLAPKTPDIVPESPYTVPESPYTEPEFLYTVPESPYTVPESPYTTSHSSCSTSKARTFYLGILFYNKDKVQ